MFQTKFVPTFESGEIYIAFSVLGPSGTCMCPVGSKDYVLVQGQSGTRGLPGFTLVLQGPAGGEPLGRRVKGFLVSNRAPLTVGVLRETDSGSCGFWSGGGTGKSPSWTSVAP